MYERERERERESPRGLLASLSLALLGSFLALADPLMAGKIGWQGKIKNDRLELKSPPPSCHCGCRCFPLVHLLDG